MEKDKNKSAEEVKISRRRVLSGAISVGAVGGLGLVGGSKLVAESQKGPKSDKAAMLKKGAVILFQGDSITDGGRKRDNKAPNDTGGLGRSYASMLAGLLHADYPEHELKIYNRGISGNKIPNLSERWKEDAVDLKPDILSIMIGVNDYWHTIAFGKKYKATVEDYEKGFRELILRSQKEIPGVRIVICDPFTFREWEAYQAYRKVAKKLADELKLTYVPFQDAFDKITDKPSKKFWLWDGIHPTTPGYAQMAKVWREAVGI